jgi:surface antigen
MKTLKVLCASAVLALVQAGCTTTPTNEQTGQVVGGVIGGVLGSQVGKGSGRTAATVVGTVAGVMIGGAVGRSMDDTDRMRAQQTFESNRSNQPNSWHNPDTGYDYTVTPTNSYTAQNSGQPCRDYTTEAVIDGRREVVHGTACRQSDGTWRTMN